ncbi:hypothetical protein KO506_11555 [Polaribacter vadi]|uniref:glycosyltransferase family 10 domain-containing protein n=1 Tax=Polaribacter TaxID=52959 RepID=UPI001C080B25|nr:MULTISPECIES: glycosyltransferase family 10 [Polaribacter]MBU3012041.1 hypothetical protein [Polaribacter vadi]MDO6741856.1 glycosyltransferase family 10 [Polaribacter sp. 1_MG-2023]
MNSKPAIGLIPYGKFPNFGLRNMSLDDLHWPLGRPQRLKNGVVADLEKTDHIITNPRKSVFLFPRFGVKAKLSVIICEPDIIHQKYINLSHYLNWRFYKILTKSEKLLESINNGIFYIYGSTFLKDIDTVNTNKKHLISLIASNKKNLIGHKLRHEIVDYLRNNNSEAHIMGRGYKPFDNKEDGLAPYKYSVVIENNQESNYFTEKLIDCFLCETVPIYWGAPNIEKYFDPKGMIICNSSEDIKNAIKSISNDDYELRLEALKANKEEAYNYNDFEKKAATLINNSLIEN